MLFYDSEIEQIISLEELKQEYTLLKKNHETESESFDIFIENCLSENNGTLDIITSDILNFTACLTYGNDNKPIDYETAQYNIDCWKKEGTAIPKHFNKWIYTALYNYLIK